MKKIFGVTFLLHCVCCLFSQINLNQGLVAYYPFSGNANDASGNNNHGTVLNGAQLTTDKLGNPNSAYYFDGIDDFIQILNSPGLNPVNGMSVVVMFNPEQNGVQTLIGKIGYNIGLGTQFQVAMDFGLHPGVLYGVNPLSNDCFGVPLNAAYVNTGNPILLNQWYCIVGTFQNGTLSIYLNGTLIETVNTGFANLNQCTNADIQIGSWWTGDLQRYKGKIDEVRLYNRALNQQEVSALCNTNVVLCNGSLGDPVVNITFGSGNNPATPLSTIVPGASTTLTFIPVSGNPAKPTPLDGQYTISNNTPLNDAWHYGMADHTPNDINGYLAFYNSQETPGLEFYRQTIDNLCGSTTYEFAAWIANCLNPASMNGVDPDITFVIERLDGTQIAIYSTGAITESAIFTWKQYGFYFTMPASESTVILKMINSSVGGIALPGNDLAIDDITFRPCGPSSNASFSVASQTDSLTVCEGSAVTLYGNLSAGFNTPNYRWQSSTDSGLTWTDVPSSNSLQFSFITIGTGLTIRYRMVSGDGNNINSINCRINSNQIVLRIRPRPIFSAPTAASAACEKKSLQLNGNNSNLYNYLWTPARYLNDPTSPNPVSTPDSSIVYAIRISEPVCNHDSNFTLSVNVNANPIVTAQKAGDIDCSTPSTQLQANGALIYSWSPSGGLDNPNASNPIASVTTNTTFMVTGTNEFGCTDTDTVSVKVTNGGKPIFVLPNAFTPNGDGKNECFGIQRWGNVTVNEFSIYNRWGQQVFTTKDPSKCWNGTINGQKQITGGYTYVINASSFCGEIKKTGIVMLIR